MTHRIVCALAVSISCIAVSHAQQRPAGPAFEVASIKPNRSAQIGAYFGPQRGQLVARNVTLWEMIRNAYRLQGFQIVGGPDWLLTARFDVIAKAVGEPTMEELMMMTQALLAERFKLAVHRETRQLPVYELVLAAPSRGAPSALRRSHVWLSPAPRSEISPRSPVLLSIIQTRIFASVRNSSTLVGRRRRTACSRRGHR